MDKVRVLVVLVLDQEDSQLKLNDNSVKIAQCGNFVGSSLVASLIVEQSPLQYWHAEMLTC